MVLAMVKTKLFLKSPCCFFPVCLMCFWAVGCMESQESKFQRLNQEGNTHFAGREYRAALTKWQNALEIRPDDGQVHFNVGNAYLKLADVSRAVSQYRQAADILPDRQDIQLALAKLHLISGDLPAAETLLENLRSLSRDDPEIDIVRGDLELLNNRPAAAQAFYERAAALSDRTDTALIKLAIGYLAQNETGEAYKTYQMVADLAPGTADVLLQMYHFWNLQGDTAQAGELLGKAVALEPENLSLHMELAEFYFETHQYEKCNRALENLMPNLPEDRYAKELMVESLMAQGRMPEAKAVLYGLSGSGARDAGLALLQGKYHLMSGEYISALGSFKSALQIDPNIPVAHYLQGVALLADGRNSLARRSLIEALRLDPLFVEAELLLADIYYKQSDHDLGAEHARRIAEREPANFRAYQVLGNICLAQARYDQALSAFGSARKLHPDSVQALYYMAVAAEKSGRMDAALATYQSLLAAHPDLADAAMRYARLLVAAGKVDTAIAFSRAAVDRAPRSGLPHHILGEVYLLAGHPSKAQKSFEKAIEFSPGLAPAYLRIAALHGASANQSAQLEVLLACIENKPRCVEAYLELANLYHKESNLAKAAEILEAGLLQNENSGWLANNLAWIYLEQDRNLPETMTLAQSAYERLPKEAAVADTLGWAYYKNGFFSKAVRMLEEAAAMSPEIALTHFHLGSACKAAGDMEAAEKSIGHALALGLKDPISGYYDLPVAKESDLFIQERRHEHWGEGERTFALYDNEGAQALASPDAPMIFPRSDRFVPADIIPVNLPLHIALQHSIQIDNTLANLLYANLKLKRLIEEYEALQKNAEALLSDISTPVLDADFFAKDFQRFGSLHKTRQELTWSHLTVVRKLRSGSAADVPQKEKTTFAHVESLTALVARSKTTAELFPEKNFNPHMDVAVSDGTAFRNGDEGNRIQTSRSVDTSLPWIFEVALKTIGYLAAHKIEVLVSAAIFMFVIMMLASIRRR